MLHNEEAVRELSYSTFGTLTARFCGTLQGTFMGRSRGRFLEEAPSSLTCPVSKFSCCGVVRVQHACSRQVSHASNRTMRVSHNKAEIGDTIVGIVDLKADSLAVRRLRIRGASPRSENIDSTFNDRTHF